MHTAQHSRTSRPAQAGYRMPAEWEPHEATWLSWPSPDGTKFRCAGDVVLPVFAKIIDALAGSEPVRISVRDDASENAAREFLREKGVETGHVSFFHIPVNGPWCRDHGPGFVTRDASPSLAVVDWEYNGWGWKYPPFNLDDEVPGRIAGRLGVPIYDPGMVLEGGSIDVNGTGTLLTTKSCLLNPNRNPDLTKKEIEQKLSDQLGVRNILWLGDGIEGDDTNGHVNCLARFVNRTTVVTAVEEDSEDPNYEPLQANLARLREMITEDGTPLEVHLLPMPQKIMHRWKRLPASYAGFYIANRVVLLPSFADCSDLWAVSVLHAAFPDRRVIPIDCRELIRSGGGLHSLVLQQPLVGRS